MSRIGRRPIPLPPGVSVTAEPGSVTVTGPKGTLTKCVPAEMSLNVEAGVLTVERPSDAQNHRALHGLTRTLVANMVEGVTNGYQKTLEVIGVGYRTGMSGKNLTVSVGYAHGIEIAPRPGIEFEAGTDQQTRTPFLVVRGIDKELVGLVAAQIRRLRPPEPYKGKGLRYKGQQVRRKAGKAGKAGGKGAK